MDKYVIYFLCLIIIGCTNNRPESASIKGDVVDSSVLQLENRLKPIKENFERISAIQKWTLIQKKELQESAEGGEVVYYYLDNKLEKVVAKYYGETGKRVEEYYLLNGQLSFVLERSEQYNRPVYWDSTQMKENNDTATFDTDKSEVVEDRFYFENGVIIHNRNNQDCGAPDAIEFVKEEKRIIIDYNNLMRLLSK